jgi:hypothetical protein
VASTAVVDVRLTSSRTHSERCRRAGGAAAVSHALEARGACICES